MKNKKFIYILIPSVIIIWGLVLRQIIYLSKPKSQSVIIYKNEKATEKEELVSYKILANYQDPFLGRIPSKKSEKPVKQNNVGRITRKNIILSDRKPELKYYGMIICENNKVGLVSYEEKLILVRELSKINDLFISAITTDSITIKYNEKTISYYSGR